MGDETLENVDEINIIELDNEFDKYKNENEKKYQEFLSENSIDKQISVQSVSGFMTLRMRNYNYDVYDFGGAYSTGNNGFSGAGTALFKVNNNGRVSRISWFVRYRRSTDTLEWSASRYKHTYQNVSNGNPIEVVNGGSTGLSRVSCTRNTRFSNFSMDSGAFIAMFP